MQTPIPLGPSAAMIDTNLTIGKKVLDAYRFGEEGVNISYRTFIRGMARQGVSAAGSNEVLGILGIKSNTDGILVQR